jgi:hypothetical protein
MADQRSTYCPNTQWILKGHRSRATDSIEGVCVKYGPLIHYL